MSGQVGALFLTTERLAPPLPGQSPAGAGARGSVSSDLTPEDVETGDKITLHLITVNMLVL